MAWGLLGHAITLGTGGAIAGANVNSVGANLVILTTTWMGGPWSSAPYDNLGNAYTFVNQVQSVQQNWTAIWFCVNPLTTTNHYFVQPHGTGSIASYAWSGSSPVSPRDQMSANGSPSSGAIIPTRDGELLIFAASAGGGEGAASGSPDSGFIFTDQVVNNGVAFGLSQAYLIQGAKATVNPTWTLTAGGIASCLASFFPPSVGGSMFNVFGM